jgi:DNA-binding Lrp family transcriptional regulator
VPALDEYVDGGHDPPIWCRDHSRVVAGAEQHAWALVQPFDHALDQAELALLGNGDDALPFRSDTVWHAVSAERRGRDTCRATLGVPVTVQAYILIQTEVGKAAAVAAEIAKIKGVTQAEDVTGPYDVIVRSEARSVDELGKLVVAKVQAVPGITRTLTCPVVHL